MTGQTKDWAEVKKADKDGHSERPKETVTTDGKKPADSVDPSTREILHMLQMMEGKTSA